MREQRLTIQLGRRAVVLNAVGGGEGKVGYANGRQGETLAYNNGEAGNHNAAGTSRLGDGEEKEEIRNAGEGASDGVFD